MFFSYWPLEGTMKQCQVQQRLVWGGDLGTYLLNLPLHPHCPDQGFIHPQFREGTQNSGYL